MGMKSHFYFLLPIFAADFDCRAESMIITLLL